MLKSLFAATATLALGLMVGCGGSKSKNGGAPGPVPVQCDSGFVYDIATDTCVGISVQDANLALTANLQVTSGNLWEDFLDDYFFSTRQSVCRNNNVEWTDLFVSFGVTNCETYTRDRTITIRLNSLLVAADGSTAAEVFITARSSWGG